MRAIDLQGRLISNRRAIKPIIEELQFSEQELTARDLETLRSNPVFRDMLDHTLPGIEQIIVSR